MFQFSSLKIGFLIEAIIIVCMHSVLHFSVGNYGNEIQTSKYQNRKIQNQASSSIPSSENPKNIKINAHQNYRRIYQSAKNCSTMNCLRIAPWRNVKCVILNRSVANVLLFDKIEDETPIWVLVRNKISCYWRNMEHSNMDPTVVNTFCSRVACLVDMQRCRWHCCHTECV